MPVKILKHEWSRLHPALKCTYHQAGLHITQSATHARISHEQWIDPYAENTEITDPDHIALDITLE